MSKRERERQAAEAKKKKKKREAAKAEQAKPCSWLKKLAIISILGG